MTTSAMARGVDYRATELAIATELSFSKWQDLLKGLGVMATGHQWWIGDALVYGEKLYPEDKFSQGAEALELEPATMTNYRWVASSVAATRRREDLTWSHHAEVARLEPADQAKMLREAAERAWGIRELRAAIAVRFPQPGREPPQREQLFTPAEEADINRRLEGLGVALELAHENPDRWHEHVDLSDVDWLYRVARHYVRA